jgi:tetratricopeptide (TPR) repeat protein
MRIWISSLTLAVLAAGCSTSQPSKAADPAPAPAPAEAPVAAKPAAPEAARPQSGSEWEELLNKLKSNYAVTEQQKASQADEHYRLAERYYTAGDFEKAEVECQKALTLSGNHAPARALLTEVQFILGKGKATPATKEYDSFMQEALVRHQQLLIEIDNAYERGKRDYNMGEYDNAEREFRKILEFSKWMPTGVELETRRK